MVEDNFSFCAKILIVLSKIIYFKRVNPLFYEEIKMAQRTSKIAGQLPMPPGIGKEWGGPTTDLKPVPAKNNGNMKKASDIAGQLPFPPDLYAYNPPVKK